VPEDDARPGEVAPRDMRVSDAEREHVAGLLQKAVGRGLITLDEFTERTDRALIARTRGELNSVLVDLADLRQADVLPTEQPLLLQTGSGHIKQRGRWVVPRTITAECGMGNITIDFTEATCPHHEMTVRATVTSGNITIIVPRGWQVILVEATIGMGSVANKATDPPDPDQPVLRVHGRARMGSVKVRHPRSRR
jgi:Domain of unknown function (DUF1707)/Cell wall-active antibiotics response 4TMS YvqF